jgi:uncharacterized protein
MKLSEKSIAFIIQTILAKVPSKIGLSIILFGGHATGRPRSTSDIDIAIKSPGPLSPLSLSSIKEVFEESDIPQPIDVLDYHLLKPSFQKVIDETGRILWRSDA